MDKIEKALYLINNSKLNEAQRVLNDVIIKSPKDFNAIHLTGIIYAKKKEFKIALNFFDKALQVNPKSADAYHNRGNALRELKEFDKAILDIEKAIQLNEKYIYFNTLGCIHFEMGQSEKANNSLLKSYSLNDKYCEPLNNLAKLSLKKKKINQAIDYFKKSLFINNNDHNVLNDLGSIFLSINNFEEALNLFNKGIELSPNNYNLNLNLGNLFSNEKCKKFHFETSRNFYDKAISIDKVAPNAYLNLGLLYKIIGDNYNAIKYFNIAFDLEKTYQYKFLEKKTNSTIGELIDSKLKIFDWSQLEEHLKIISLNYNHYKNLNPLSSLYILDNPMPLKEIAKEQVDQNLFSFKNFNKPEKILIKEKINIAFFSGDFGNHAVTHLILGFFKNYNKDSLKVHAFSLKNKKDKYQEEIKRNVDLFYDVENLTDEEIINLSVKKNIHIGIDLSGYTKYCRPNIFYNRAAPIQVNYLGYPGTSSIENMDYIIADKTLISENDKINYTEKIAYLPSCYQINDQDRPRPKNQRCRKDFGIPDDVFLFGCFNHIHKIQPIIFKCWMSILNKKKDSMLWLLCNNLEIITNIKKYAETNGINPSRILFADIIDIESHLARIPLVDLMIDTYPYGAHTTASDTLWMGVPIVSIFGKTFASRVCSSLLKAVGLEELITHNISEYENLIIKISNNKNIICELKKKIEIPYNLDLFNSKKTSEQIGNLCKVMIKNYNKKKNEDINLK